MLIYNFDLFLEYTAMTQLTCLHWNSSSVLAPYSGQRERAARGIMDDGVLSGIGDVDTCGMGALFFVGVHSISFNNVLGLGWIENQYNQNSRYVIGVEEKQT